MNVRNVSPATAGGPVTVAGLYGPFLARLRRGPGTAAPTVAAQRSILHPDRLMIRAVGVRIDTDGTDPIPQPRADEAVVEPRRAALHLRRRSGIDGVAGLDPGIDEAFRVRDPAAVRDMGPTIRSYSFESGSMLKSPRRIALLGIGAGIPSSVHSSLRPSPETGEPSRTAFTCTPSSASTCGSRVSAERCVRCTEYRRTCPPRTAITASRAERCRLIGPRLPYFGRRWWRTVSNGVRESSMFPNCRRRLAPSSPDSGPRRDGDRHPARMPDGARESGGR